MKSQTSLVATNIRLNDWALQIQDCINRPKGMDVSTWCAENGITKANYYYRLRRVREANLQSIMPDDEMPFVEIGSLQASTEIQRRQDAQHTVATIRISNNVEICITDQASQTFLRNLIGAVSHVE